MQAVPMAGDVIPEVLSFLTAQVQLLRAQGVDHSRITLDPGVGFGKTVAQNFALLARQRELLAAGYPLLLGWSRKSSIGAVTGIEAAGERIVPSVAAAVLAVDRGAAVVRVHDVRDTVAALAVWRAMKAQESQQQTQEQTSTP
jgi:dihydropteroate synthase